MAVRAVSTADVGQEGLCGKLGVTDYQLRRALAKLPQDARFLLSRYYGVGFPAKSRGELMSEMDLTSMEFQALHDEALARLRRGPLCDEERG